MPGKLLPPGDHVSDNIFYCLKLLIVFSGIDLHFFVLAFVLFLKPNGLQSLFYGDYSPVC